MSPTIEIIAQLIWIALGVGLIVRGYLANKKSPKVGFDLLNKNQPLTLNPMFQAGGIVIGFVLIILLVHKFVTCGLVCGYLLP